MSTATLLASPDFQTFLSPWPSRWSACEKNSVFSEIGPSLNRFIWVVVKFWLYLFVSCFYWNNHLEQNLIMKPPEIQIELKKFQYSVYIGIFKKQSTSTRKKHLNRSSRRKRGMASNPLFIISDFFFIFKNELSYGYLRFEGNWKISFLSTFSTQDSELRLCFGRIQDANFFFEIYWALLYLWIYPTHWKVWWYCIWIIALINISCLEMSLFQSLNRECRILFCIQRINWKVWWHCVRIIALINISWQKRAYFNPSI